MSSEKLVFICFLLVSFFPGASADDTRPNILFIFTDDQSVETIGANGLADIDTPNLDRLANEGTTFSHAYNMGSWLGAVCVASRTCLNTGSFLWRAQAALQESKDGQRKLWGQLMSEAGYDTYMTGKWHIPVNPSLAFDKVVNVRPGMPKSIDGYNRPSEGEDSNEAWLPWDTSREGFWTGGKHWSEVTADHCISFIEEASSKTDPFFMYVAFNAPHDPRQSPKEFIDRYPLERIRLPENYRDLYPDMGEDGVPKIRDENLGPYPRTEYAAKVHRQEYFAIMTHLDEQIGRIMHALEESGKAENTLIIFTSDHGLAIWQHGLLGKQNMYEHSLRAPFILWGPDVAAGRVIDAPIYLQDAMPTTLELSGQEVPDYVDYKSLLPLLDGSRKQNYEAIYGAYLGTQRAVVKDGWKLIAYPLRDVLKLFNLNSDPLEMNDLSSNAAFAPRLLEMTQLLETQMDFLGDPMPSLNSPEYLSNTSPKGVH